MNNNLINILFIGGLASESCINEFQNNSRKGYQFAAQNLEDSIITGLKENSVKVSVISIPGISTYPFGYRKMVVSTSDFVFKGESIGWTLGFYNIPFFNHPSNNIVDRHVRMWYDKAQGKKVIIVYSLNKMLMEIAIRAKRKYDDIVIVIIVPDLPRYMGCNRLYKLLGLQKKDIRYIYKNIVEFDGYVVLAKEMVNDLKVEDRPFTVMEGIYCDDIKPIQNKDNKESIVLYTGNLGRKYGIQTLLDSFDYIKNKDIELWIRGDGEMKVEIMRRAEKDKRLKYIGPMSKEEIYELQKSASILINPVSPQNDFTRYFFPSKTMNYLSSGRPVLMYDLKCLPEEYKEYLFFIDGEGAINMANAIQKVLGYRQEELLRKGELAQKFIKHEKCAMVQCKKIVDLIESLFMNTEKND